MANFMDLLVDEDTGDLAIVGGDFELTSTSKESLRQRLELRFGTWKGQWPYNTAFGTPYRQRLFVGGTTKEQADAEFIAQVNLESDVTQVKNVISTLDNTTRSYVLSRIEAYVNEEVVNLSLASPQTTNFSYPEPVEQEDITFNVCELDQEFIDNSNALYELLNFDLPETGDETWFNLWV
jgi:hypothetical protein